MLKIGIFCASSNHIAPIYYEQTAGLGKWIGTHHHTIVYGGITQGLMECVAKNVKESGGQTIGVILQDMFECELASPNLDQLIITNDLAERKNKIMEISDVFIALPGGFGTLDEIFHIVAGGQVGYHEKPLLLFNQNGFYNHLIQQIKQIFTEQFAAVKHQKRIVAVNTIDECIDALLKVDLQVDKKV